MKIEKSDNPAAVGALVVVLVLIVGRISWMVLGHSRTAEAASRGSIAAPVPNAVSVPATQMTSAAAAAPAPEPARDSSAVMPVTTRNPFSVVIPPARTAARQDGQSPRRDAARRAASRTETIPLMPLPPLPVRALEPGLGRGGTQPAALHGLSALRPFQSAAKGQASLVATLKLTAIVGGTEPLAVVQTANPEPVILHVGDFLDGMRVAAIHDQEVVFARGNGFWTLSLQSAADNAAAGSVSVTSVPADAPPVVSVATPEEKTDELQP